MEVLLHPKKKGDTNHCFWAMIGMINLVLFHNIRVPAKGNQTSDIFTNLWEKSSGLERVIHPEAS